MIQEVLSEIYQVDFEIMEIERETIVYLLLTINEENNRKGDKE